MARDTFFLKIGGIVLGVLLLIGIGIAAAMLLRGDDDESEQVAISQEDLNELDEQLNDALAEDRDSDSGEAGDGTRGVIVDMDSVEAEPAATERAVEEAPAAERPAAAPAPSRTTPAAPSRTTPAPGASAPTGDATSHNAAGLRLFEQGNYTAALERFARARQSAPRDPHVLNNYAWTLHKLNRQGEAARELQAVLDLDPDRDIAYANLGEVLLAQGDRQGAIAAYERFLELNDNPARENVARRKLEQIRAGD